MQPACLAVAMAVAAAGASLLPERLAMPFFCLERCNSTVPDVERAVRAAVAQAGVLGAVATERYNLGAGGRLVRATNLTDSVALLRKFGWPASAPVIAMVSSFPYPPQFAGWMRQAFADPEPLIADLLAEAEAAGLGGFNIDWEPLADTIQPADAEAYASFLGMLARRMHQHGLSVTADVASWSPLWNTTALAELAAPFLDGIMTMSTYTDSQRTWPDQLRAAVAAFGPSGHLIVGLETTRINGTAYPQEQLRQRFRALRAAGQHRVGLWRAPVPASWEPLLSGL